MGLGFMSKRGGSRQRLAMIDTYTSETTNGRSRIHDPFFIGRNDFFSPLLLPLVRLRFIKPSAKGSSLLFQLMSMQARFSAIDRQPVFRFHFLKSENDALATWNKRYMKQTPFWKFLSMPVFRLVRQQVKWAFFGKRCNVKLFFPMKPLRSTRQFHHVALAFFLLNNFLNETRRLFVIFNLFGRLNGHRGRLPEAVFFLEKYRYYYIINE